MRLFIGLPIDPGLREKLQAASSPLRSAMGAMRWAEPNSWHVTLQFLGRSTPDQLACLRGALGAVKSPEVLLSLGALGCFGGTGVLHVEVRPSGHLLALQRRIVEATSPCGFEPETRPYHPHITLARMKKNGKRGSSRSLERVSRNVRPDSLSGRVNQFCLYESLTLAEGARYEILACFPLELQKVQGP